MNKVLRKACISLQSDLAIPSSSTYPTISIDSVSGQRRPRSACVKRRLIRACVVRKLHKSPVLALRINMLIELLSNVFEADFRNAFDPLCRKNDLDLYCSQARI